MTIQVNIAEAKSKLSELVARAEAGEEVVLARAGKPVVTLAAVTPVKPKHRRIGDLAHLGPLTEHEATMFLGEDEELIEAAESRDEDEFYRS